MDPTSGCDICHVFTAQRQYTGTRKIHVPQKYLDIIIFLFIQYGHAFYSMTIKSGTFSEIILREKIFIPLGILRHFEKCTSTKTQIGCFKWILMFNNN